MSDKPPLSPVPPASFAGPAPSPNDQKQETAADLKPAAGAEPSERPHHPYSPSTLQSLEACPLFLSRQGTPHARTIAGTKAHNAAEKERDDETLSDEDAAAVAECLDYVEALIQQRRADGMANCPAPSFSLDIIKEAYLAIDDVKFVDAISTTAGYVDQLLLSWDRKAADITDYKFGNWPVTNATENLQGIAYALGVFWKWPSVQQVTIHFLQPLIRYKTKATIRREDIPEHYFRISAVVAQARVARQKLAEEEARGVLPSYEGARCYAPVCAFCDRLGKCRKALDIALKVGNKFHPLEVPDDITPTMVHSPENTQKAMSLALVVAAWAKAFRTVLTDRVIRGDAPVPAGFKIVQQSRRELVDMEAYRKLAIKLIGAKAFQTTLETTFGAVEELIMEKAPRGMKTKVVTAFQAETEACGAVQRGLPYAFLKAVPKGHEAVGDKD